jgi:hypothetical protein
MQTTSALYKQILANQNHWFETKLLIVGVGEFDETQLFSISTNIEMFQNSPTIGTASAGEIEVKMLNPAEQIPTMATLIPYVRAVGLAPTGGSAELDNDILSSDGATISNDILVFAEGTAVINENDIVEFLATDYEESYSEWIQQGVYFVDTREVIKSESNVDVLVLHGYDAMLKAEQMFVSSTILGDSVDIDMVNEIARIMGVAVDERTTALMTMGYTIPLPTGYTLRDVLGYIASMYVGGFIITDVGKLRLVSVLEMPEETNYLINEEYDYITFGGYRILV